MTQPERGIWLDDATHREDLATFTERALRLDDAAVVRLRERGGGRSSITALRSIYYMVKVLLALFVGLFRRDVVTQEGSE